MKLKQFFTVAAVLGAIATPLSAASNDDSGVTLKSAIADLFGRIIYVAGGSTISHHISPMAVLPYSRRNIELGYSHSWRSNSDKGISLANSDDRSVVNITYVMIDCVNKTYSLYPEDETNMGMIAYRSGSDFKWGDYEQLGFDSHESVTGPISKLFEDACTLSEKF